MFDIVILPYLACVASFFLQLLVDFLECSAIFTDLSFFTVITTGYTKQSNSRFVQIAFFPSGQIDLVIFFLFQYSFVNGMLWVQLSVFMVGVPASLVF